MKRRTKVRWISFGAALFAALLCWAISATVTANNRKRVLDAAQEQALTQMCECLDQIETDLQKATYAVSPEMFSRLSEDLNTNTVGAKTSLSTLNAGNSAQLNLFKFLSQVNAFTASLRRKTADGGALTQTERTTLKKLRSYAKSLSSQFNYMTELMNSGYFSFEEVNKELKNTDANSENMVSYLSAISDAEDSMTDFPTLIYDGPFSDNIMNKTSKLLERAEEVSLSAARDTAARALGVEPRLLFSDSSSEGKLAAYNFHCDNKRVAVTKRGGYVSYLLSDGVAGEERLSSADAVRTAANYLNTLGYGNMASTYYASADGICTVNFAYRQGDYICYPDLITVSVSLSGGGIIAMDAGDYLMNHVSRAIPAPKITEEAAQQTAAESLSVLRTKKAVIPTETGAEKFAYELLCEDDAGQQVLVYVDTVSGEEDDILILLYADGGTLTK